MLRRAWPLAALIVTLLAACAKLEDSAPAKAEAEQTEALRQVDLVELQGTTGAVGPGGNEALKAPPPPPAADDLAMLGGAATPEPAPEPPPEAVVLAKPAPKRGRKEKARAEPLELKEEERAVDEVHRSARASAVAADKTVANRPAAPPAPVVVADALSERLDEAPSDADDGRLRAAAAPRSQTGRFEFNALAVDGDLPRKEATDRKRSKDSTGALGPAQAAALSDARDGWLSHDQIARQGAGRVRLVPAFAGGAPRGVRVTGLAQDTPLHALGVRNGDVILTIDGAPAEASTARAQLTGERPPVIEIERAGGHRVLYPELSAAQAPWAAGPKPTRFLPRVGYFENTYLGRSPAYLRQVRGLDARFGDAAPYGPAALPPQALDAPEDAGLALSATLDRPDLSQPGRVFLQVGLKGSERFGWRRPPLDVALVVDGTLAAEEPEVLTRAVTGLLRRLDARDRLGVIVAQADGPRVLTDVIAVRDARRTLVRSLVDGTALRPSAAAAPLGAALDAAGAALLQAASGQARVPGSQTVLLLTRGGDPQRVRVAAQAAHRLTLQGAITSVIDLDPDTDAWWQVAQAGHGHDHRGRALNDALDAELASLAQVIGRLLRLNIRLAPDVRAVRILGSRMLSDVEKREVKAREVATDRQLSKTLGLTADRGDDDDGLQVVIPYFHGGDAHVVLVELWVERPGPVAEITLKYKDMVQIGNATARASARLDALPTALTDAHRAVRDNVRGFEFAQALDTAAQLARGGRLDEARQALRDASPVTAGDRAVLARFNQAWGSARGPLADALSLASRRRIADAR